MNCGEEEGSRPPEPSPLVDSSLVHLKRHATGRLESICGRNAHDLPCAYHQVITAVPAVEACTSLFLLERRMHVICGGGCMSKEDFC
jgi:hypothetical protein